MRRTGKARAEAVEDAPVRGPVAGRVPPASPVEIGPRSDAPSNGTARMDADTLRAVNAFASRLGDRYTVRDIILFGSRARRSHRADSDADLAVVLEGESGDRPAAVRDMAGTAFDVLMATGILIEPLPLWEGEWARPELFRNPALIRNIRRDGLRL